eukprot:1914594-Prymnesium_polylepis.1
MAATARKSVDVALLPVLLFHMRRSHAAKARVDAAIRVSRHSAPAQSWPAQSWRAMAAEGWRTDRQMREAGGWTAKCVRLAALVLWSHTAGAARRRPPPPRQSAEGTRQVWWYSHTWPMADDVARG